MLLRFKIPKTILWVINLFLVLLFFFIVFRFITFFAFRPPAISLVQSTSAFLLGVQYDIRWISIIVLPIILLSSKQSLSPFYSATNKKIWSWYLAVTIFLVFFFFVADLVSFSYNRTRLDAGAMNFMEDPGISLSMMWQTYPLIWILLGLLCAIVCFKWLVSKSHWQVINVTDGMAILHRPGPFIIAALLLSMLIYGRIGSRPLKWGDAFALKDGFKSYLALNPLQNFFSTMRLREPVYNEAKAREVFPLMADFLQLPQRDEFNFKRMVAPRSGAFESQPNIVLVICESFSMYKSSMSGNKLNTTPFFDSLTRQGIFFERCFSPHFSTARGLFATITGIPDVQFFKFSTRNPAAINQKTIINNFEGYAKHYFLGGDPQFNNFEGLLTNIHELQIHTEKNIDAPKVNVWGVSDKDLFLAANKVFRQEKKPFFAIVQTSFNHRPYTIPEADIDFERKIENKDTLAKYGFQSLDEYNTFRYSDYCFEKFIRAAQMEQYFHNTIFVFIGDHGVAGNATSVYPQAWTSQRLSDEHIPLLFYAPHLLEPQTKSEVVSQIDVLPTIAGMVQKSYTNTTLGRDLLNPQKKNDVAFITNAAGKIGIVTNTFYYIKSLEANEEEMVPVQNTLPGYNQYQLDSIRTSLAKLTNAFYQTAQYLLMNNKQR